MTAIRNLQIATHFVLMMTYIDEENLQNVPIEDWIEQAEAEIAKERES